MAKEKSADRLKLEAEASLLEIPFGSNWKDETIADKIAEAKAKAAQDMTEAEAERQTGSAPIPETDGESQGAEDAQTAASASAAGSGDVASVPDNGGTGGGDTAPAQPDPGATFTVDPSLEAGKEICEVLDALRHDGESYGPGDPVRLSEDDAKALCAAGVVSRRT